MRKITQQNIEQKDYTESQERSIANRYIDYTSQYLTKVWKQEELLNLNRECKPVYIYINKKTKFLDWCFKGQKLKKEVGYIPQSQNLSSKNPFSKILSSQKTLYENSDCQIMHVSIRPKTEQEAVAYFAYYVYIFLCKNPNTINNKNADPKLIEIGKTLWLSDIS